MQAVVAVHAFSAVHTRVLVLVRHICIYEVLPAGDISGPYVLSVSEMW